MDAGVAEEPWNEGVQQPYWSRRWCLIIRREANEEKHRMGTTYEYKFVRLGDYRGSAWFGVSDKARNDYEDVVHVQARDG